MDTEKCKKEAVIKLDGEEIERVNSFEYLGARIEANGEKFPRNKKKTGNGNIKIEKMASIWKGHSIDTKVRILKCIVFPTATYGCEAWTINNTDSKKITSFEMNCYRNILRIPWTQKVSNEEVLLRIGIVSPSLLQNVKKLKLSYFGHIKRHDSLEKHILEAKVAGKRGRGRPSRRWEQDIQEWMGTTITQAGRMAEDRTMFRKKVREATSCKRIG